MHTAITCKALTASNRYSDFKTSYENPRVRTYRGTSCYVIIPQYDTRAPLTTGDHTANGQRRYLLANTFTLSARTSGDSLLAQRGRGDDVKDWPDRTRCDRPRCDRPQCDRRACRGGATPRVDTTVIRLDATAR